MIYIIHEKAISTIINSLTGYFKTKNPYTMIITFCLEYVLLDILMDFIKSKIKKDKYDDDTYIFDDDVLNKKRDEFDKWYKEAANKLPKLEIDPIILRRFKRESIQLQKYVDELYVYLNNAYSTDNINVIDDCIISVKDLINRMSNK